MANGPLLWVYKDWEAVSTLLDEESQEEKGSVGHRWPGSHGDCPTGLQGNTGTRAATPSVGLQGKLLDGGFAGIINLLKPTNNS